VSRKKIVVKKKGSHIKETREDQGITKEEKKKKKKKKKGREKGNDKKIN